MFSYGEEAKAPTGEELSEEEYEIERNARATVRDCMINYVNNISISDLESVQSQAGLLSSLTSSTDEMTRDSTDTVTNQCLRLIEVMGSYTDASAESLDLAAQNIAKALANMVASLNVALSGKKPPLTSDFTAANSYSQEFDTDVESFWTNPNNFAVGGTPEQVEAAKNEQRSKYMSVDMIEKIEYVMGLLSKTMASHLTLDQDFTVKTPFLHQIIKKIKAQDLPNEIELEGATITLPTYCDLIGEETPPDSDPNLPILPQDENNCKNKVVIFKASSMPVSKIGHNGNNESFSGSSISVSLGFFDEDNNPIDMAHLSRPIEFFITRNPLLEIPPFEPTNATETVINNDDPFMPMVFTNMSVNSSVHIEIKPESEEVGYLVLFKFGETPKQKKNSDNADSVQLFCPPRLSNNFLGDYRWYTDSDGNLFPYFVFVLPMHRKSTKRDKTVGYGIRELTQDEMDLYCTPNRTSYEFTDKPVPYIEPSEVKFTSNFGIRAYLSGCYYYDLKTGKWNNDGVFVGRETNITHTQCFTYHLTEFAGGLLILPNEINFKLAFEDVSFTSNPIIYSTIIACVCIYIFCGLAAHIQDRYDAKRTGIALLPDNMPDQRYYYEIIVVTGSRFEAETDSKVFITITGDKDESDSRQLKDTQRKAFRRGGMDSFIMAVKAPLGNLSWIRIWHDNSGHGSSASWYLKHIIIHDVQTRERFYFVCNKWLAVEKGECVVDRAIPIAMNEQLLRFGTITKKTAKENMAEDHMWFSIYARPVKSNYNRLQRVTCAFVFLYLIMLFHILYFELDYESRKPGKGPVSMGPIDIAPKQLLIGFMIVSLTIIPTIFIIEIFRRSRARVVRTEILKKMIRENNRVIDLLKTDKFKSRNQDPINDILSNVMLNNSLYKKPNRNQSIVDQTLNENIIDDEPIKAKHGRTKSLFQFTFPWWFTIVGFIVSWSIMIICIVFTILKSLEYGNDLTKKWVIQLAISIITSIFITEPLKVLVITMFFIMLCRRHIDNYDIDTDADDTENSLNNNREWLNIGKDKSYRRENYISKLKSSMAQHEVELAKRDRINYLTIISIIREILIYVSFLWILYVVTYTNSSGAAFNYQTSLTKQFANPSPDWQKCRRDESECSGGEMSGVITPADFWLWAKRTFAPGLRADRWYNNAPQWGLTGFFNDYTSRIIGYGMLRQVRVKGDTCNVASKMSVLEFPFCNADFTNSIEETKNFGYGWSNYNESFVPANGWPYIYNSFQYRNATELNSIDSRGLYDTYPGGGYIYQVRGAEKYLVGNLSILQRLGWIDRNTRAVIAEFAAYNPNLNIFIVTSIIYEFLASGTIVAKARFDPLDLFNGVNGIPVFVLICDILYIAFIIYFAINEICSMIKERRNYISFWAFVEWGIIISSCMGFGIYIYRYTVAVDLLDFVQKTNGYQYIKLQKVSMWSQVFEICVGICAFLGTLKFMKLLRFNTKMNYLSSTLSIASHDLAGFIVVFFIVWIAYVQIMFLAFQRQLMNYSTLPKAAATSFQIMVGKFDARSLYEADKYLGTIIIASYNFVIIFFMLNVFLSIIGAAFEVTRANEKEKNEQAEYDIFDFLSYHIRKFLNWNIDHELKEERHQELNRNKKYIEYIHFFPDVVDELIYKLTKVTISFLYFCFVLFYFRIIYFSMVRCMKFNCKMLILETKLILMKLIFKVQMAMLVV
jgi:polycystin 1L2